jgi:hypothetical protein
LKGKLPFLKQFLKQKLLQHAMMLMNVCWFWILKTRDVTWELKANKHHNFWKVYKTCNHYFSLRRVFLLLLWWVFIFYLYAPIKRA